MVQSHSAAPSNIAEILKFSANFAEPCTGAGRLDSLRFSANSPEQACKIRAIRLRSGSASNVALTGMWAQPQPWENVVVRPVPESPPSHISVVCD